MGKGEYHILPRFHICLILCEKHDGRLEIGNSLVAGQGFYHSFQCGNCMIFCNKDKYENTCSNAVRSFSYVWYNEGGSTKEVIEWQQAIILTLLLRRLFLLVYRSRGSRCMPSRTAEAGPPHVLL